MADEMSQWKKVPATKPGDPGSTHMVDGKNWRWPPYTVVCAHAQIHVKSSGYEYEERTKTAFPVCRT